MVFDPDAGELLPDGSRIQTTTAGEIADWLAENAPAPCGCENPQPYELCCVTRLIYPTVMPVRGGTNPKRRKKRRKKR